jgi:carboxymethylenebutenolidase
LNRLNSGMPLTAHNLPECNSKVAVLGYCLGALMVFLTIVRCHGVSAAVAYHDGDTEKYLRQAEGLNAPLLMHLAEEGGRRNGGDDLRF